MAFFTQAEARKAAQQSTRGNRSPREALNEIQKNYKDSDRFDTFLSHAMVDAELVLGIKVLLEAEGQKVYVDWIDDQALERDHVTAKTADMLRKRMRQSNSMLYLATENAPKSKWMPWELGYLDGRHEQSKVAICPIAAGAGSSRGRSISASTSAWSRWSIKEECSLRAQSFGHRGRVVALVRRWS